MLELVPENRTDEVKEFVSKMCGVNAPSTKTTALGFMDSINKNLLGGWLFERYTGRKGSVYCHWAAKTGGTLVTRSNLTIVGLYIFDQLGCSSLLGEVRSSNKYVINVNKRLGFEEVATIKGCFPDDDLTIMQLRRESCVWLPQELKEAS